MTIIYFCQKFYIIKIFKTKLLLKINVINFKYIIVNANKQKLIIKTC